MTRIALVLHSLTQGGTDRVAVHLTNGFSVVAETLLVTAVPGGNAGTVLNGAIAADVAVHSLRKKGSGVRAVDLLLAFPAWVRWLRRERPDIVIGTANNVSWFTVLGFALRGYRHGRLYIKTTNPILRRKDGPFVTWVRRKGYRAAFGAASGVLVLSDAEGRVLARQFPACADKFRTVQNPYVTPAMLAIGRERSSPTQTVLAIGRLDHQKNFDLLLRAWAREHRGEAHLVIVGEGPDRAALTSLAAELGIDRQVTFSGYQSDVVSWLEKADLFVLSSRYEGLPAVILEAMAAGCPIVSTDCFDAAREMLGMTPGCILVDVGDEAALADAISSAIAAPGSAARLRATAERYGLEAAVESHLVALDLV